MIAGISSNTSRKKTSPFHHAAVRIIQFTTFNHCFNQKNVQKSFINVSLNLDNLKVHVQRGLKVVCRPNFCLSICLSVYLSVCLFVCLSVCLFVCLSVCPSVCLSVTTLTTYKLFVESMAIPDLASRRPYATYRA